MWAIIATLAVTAIVVALTFFLVGPYRHPAEHLGHQPDDHGHGTH
jgi:hypothetical protein